MTNTSPNVLRAGWSIVTAVVRVPAPQPNGTGSFDHSRLAAVLGAIAWGDPLMRLPDQAGELDQYLEQAAAVDPDRLTRSEALAFWINVYNAAGLRLAAHAARRGTDSMLGVPGVFTNPVVEIAGERLSLDRIEHGKVRRFRDPRIHAALVCGAMSCPTLRSSPYTADVDAELDDQMRMFLAGGAVRLVPSRGRVIMSPIFRWFGRDFTHPSKMPTLLPARRTVVLDALADWLDPETVTWIGETRPDISYSSYDWRLGCAIG